jgi:serine/threonine protein kinase
MDKEIKIIDSGTFGCISRPYIKCDSTIGNKKFVSKIQKTNDNFTIREEKIGLLIQKIKNYKMYFAPIIKTCPINIGLIKKDELQKCSILKSTVKDDNKYQSSKIRYIGTKSLEYYISKFLWNKNFLLKETANSHLYLLNSINKLTNLGIIHYDLKENNILYDDINNIPIIIDFGLSYKITEEQNWKDVFYVYGSYEYWNIEELILSYGYHNVKDVDLSNKITIYLLENVIDEYMNGKRNIFVLKLLKDDELVMKKKLYQYIQLYKDMTWLELLTELKKKVYWKSWDNYSLSVTYLMMIDFYNISISQKYIDILKNVILSLPGERKSGIETKKELKSLFENYF